MNHSFREYRTLDWSCLDLFVWIAERTIKDPQLDRKFGRTILTGGMCRPLVGGRVFRGRGS